MSFPTALRAQTYNGSSQVSFSVNQHDALLVTIDTQRLHMRSLKSSEEDRNSYVALFSDPEVMGKYATGKPKTKEETETRIKETWVKRWHENDPYSALAVFKKDTAEFIGHVVIGHGDEAGQAELAYLFNKDHWRQGYGTEAVTAVVKEYAPATVAEGYTLDGSPLETITATARPDNPASIKILEKLGMDKTGKDEKYGALRHHYSISLSDLPNKV